MSIERELKKDGIEVVSKLSTLEVNSIAKNIADRICQSFPEFNLDSAELFIKLSRLDMYRAKIQEGMSEATYFYKNSSIYFNENIPFEKLEEFAVHECIHFLQEVKDKKNYLVRMGLCDFTEFKVYGMGLNEAAVQYMTSKIIGILPEEVKYFDINLTSPSPFYYPLESNLIQQMAFVTGQDVLFNSTFYSNEDFKNKFIEKTSEKTFYAVQNAFDTILYAEEDITKINNKIRSFDSRNHKVDGLLKKIVEHKSNITLTFLRTQNLIVSSYFDKKLDEVNDFDGLDDYRKELQNYKKLIGTADGYTFFNNYYSVKMSELDHKYNIIENGGIETALKPIKVNKFLAIIRAIKEILFGTQNYAEREKIK